MTKKDQRVCLLIFKREGEKLRNNQDQQEQQIKDFNGTETNCKCTLLCRVH